MFRFGLSIKNVKFIYASFRYHGNCRSYVLNCHITLLKRIDEVLFNFQIEPTNKMSKSDIQSMVERLHSSKPHQRPKSAYEQGGVMGSYAAKGWGLGWGRPGSGGKAYNL